MACANTATSISLSPRNSPSPRDVEPIKEKLKEEGGKSGGLFDYETTFSIPSSSSPGLLLRGIGIFFSGIGPFGNGKAAPPRGWRKKCFQLILLYGKKNCVLCCWGRRGLEEDGVRKTARVGAAGGERRKLLISV